MLSFNDDKNNQVNTDVNNPIRVNAISNFGNHSDRSSKDTNYDDVEYYPDEKDKNDLLLIKKMKKVNIITTEIFQKHIIMLEKLI